MKARIKQLILNGTKFIPMGLIKQLPVQKTLFPYHHIVSNKSVPHIENIYGFKSEKDFIKDLDFLLKHFEAIHPDVLYQNVIGHHRIPDNKFLLTFDDGFREVIDVIIPILEKKGVPAIFFINPAFINNKSIFYRNTISLLLHLLRTIGDIQPLLKTLESQFHLRFNSLEELRKYILSVQSKEDSLLVFLEKLFKNEIDEFQISKKPWLEEIELHSVYQKGFTIGAHSWDHPYYKNLSLEEQLQQTIQSCDYIHDLFPEQKVFFSFPHTDKPIKQDFFDAMKSRYSLKPLYFGVQNQKIEIHNSVIHRFNAENPKVPLKNFSKLILLNNSLQNLLSKNKVKREP